MQMFKLKKKCKKKCFVFFNLQLCDLNFNSNLFFFFFNRLPTAERLFMAPLLFDAPKRQQSILGFVVFAVHALYTTSGPALALLPCYILRT